MTLSRSSKLVAGFLILLAVGVALVSTKAIQEIRIGSQDYAEIIADKDFAADILPPPLYAVEAYSEVGQVMLDPGSLQVHRARLGELKKQFDERLAYWRASKAAPDDMKANLEEMARQAEPFWSGVERGVLPALAKGDRPEAERAYVDVSRAYRAHRASVDKLVVRAAAEETTDEARSKAKGPPFTAAILIGCGAIIVAMSVVAWLMSSQVTSALTGLSASMTALAKGDLGVEIRGAARTDEIGAMAGAVTIFKDNAHKALSLEAQAAAGRSAADAERSRAEVFRAEAAQKQASVVEKVGTGLERLSGGDLTVRLTDVPEDYLRLRDDFNSAIEALQSAMGEISANAQSMHAGAAGITEAADNMSRRTEQQAAALEQTAAAMDEITVTVRKTAEGSAQASTVVGRARIDAEQSGQVVQQAVSAMGQIEQSSQKIGQIIGVIDEIAFQTNLLALNAGVEAARAGDAGRGFAVVAQEVRALAQRSAEAAKEIKALIQASSQQVEQGVEMVGQTGTALRGIVAKVTEISRLVADISVSAQEQASGIAEVNVAINQMDLVTQQNAAMVEQSTTASHALSRDAGALAQLIGRFDTGADHERRSAGAPAHGVVGAGSPLAKPFARRSA